MSSLREKIFAAQDLKHEDVSIPEWDVVLRVHQRSAARIIEMNGEVERVPKNGMFLAAVFCVTDQEDAPVFSTPTLASPDAPDDIPEMKKKSMAVWNRLQYVAMRLNDVNGKAVDDAKKPSGEVATSGSPTALPGN